MRRAIVVFAMATGCNDSGGGPSMCEPVDGLYEVRYVEHAGDCDLGSWTEIEGYGSFEEPTECTGPQDISDDGCTETDNIRCLDEDGALRTVKGTFRVTKPDGSAFSGRAEIGYVLSDGSRCSSIYDVTGKRQ